MPNFVSKRVSQARQGDQQITQPESSTPKKRRAEGRLIEVDIVALSPNPYQPRIIYDPMKMEELVASIRADGILQPISIAVDAETGQLCIAAGHRRTEAARRLGVETLTAMDYGEHDALWFQKFAIVENNIRDDLKLFERIKGYLRLAELLEQAHPALKVTVRELAAEVGEDEGNVGKYLKIARHAVLMTELERRANKGEDASHNEFYLKAQKIEDATRPPKAVNPIPPAPDNGRADYSDHNWNTNDKHDASASIPSSGSHQTPKSNATGEPQSTMAQAPARTEKKEQRRVANPATGTMPFRGEYISIPELSEVLADIVSGILSPDTQELPRVTAPYDVEELFRQYGELGMALKSRFGSLLSTQPCICSGHAGHSIT